MKLAKISGKLAESVARLRFGKPVAHVYNPLIYARRSHNLYLERYGEGREAGRVLMLGMNPGPWGMAQTGVPFGDVQMVREWMGIEARVDRPEGEHTRVPVRGFASTRGEQSGARLWGWARDRFGEAGAFFDRFFVVNYCPLCFLDAGGRNLTPDKLPAASTAALTEACDRALVEFVDALGADLVVGIGVYAEACAARALSSREVVVGRVLHPSPASPAANRGWVEQAEKELQALGVHLS